MNISRFFLGALLLYASPCFAQLAPQVLKRPSYRLVSPSRAAKIVRSTTPTAFSTDSTMDQSHTAPFDLPLPNVEPRTMPSVGKPSDLLNVRFSSHLSAPVSWLSPGGIHITDAHDDKGHNLTIKEPTPSDITDFFTPHPVVATSLKTPFGEGRKIVLVKGTATYVVPTEHEVWKVNNLLLAQQEIHGFRCEGKKTFFILHNVKLEENKIHLNFEVRSPELASDGLWTHSIFLPSILLACLQIKDADGHQFKVGNRNIRVTPQGLSFQTEWALPVDFEYYEERGITDNIPLPSPIQPVSLLCEFPTQFVQTRVPFSFSNLTLK